MAPSNRRFIIAGFTLVELLVVLTIMAMMAATLPFAYQKLQATMQYKSTVQELDLALQQTRLSAIRYGQTRYFEIDLEQRRFGQRGALDTPIPESLTFQVTTAREAGLGGARGSIAFYPDGSATGGNIEIRRHSGQGVRIQVNWMLGRITQQPLGEG